MNGQPRHFQTQSSLTPVGDYIAWLNCGCPVADYCRDRDHREDFTNYVAELQFHMTLHARKLVPNLAKPTDSREQLLQNTQAEIEKLISRQAV